MRDRWEPGHLSLLIIVDLLLVGTSIHSQKVEHNFHTKPTNVRTTTTVKSAANVRIAPGRSGLKVSSAAQQLRMVDASLCKPFLFNGVFVSGCTNMDSPEGKVPWCRIGAEKVLCKQETMPARMGRLPGGAKNDIARCDSSTIIPGRGHVYGCFATTLGADFKCSSGNLGLLSCITAKSIVAPAEAPAVAPPSSTIATHKATPVVAAAVGGASFLLLCLVTFIVFRRRKCKRNLAVGDGSPTKEKQSDSPVSKSANKSKPVSPTRGTRPRSSVVDDRPQTFVDERGKASLGKYLISETYTPVLDDEIYIEPGDVVEIMEEFDDGWCYAINYSRNMAEGVIPNNCIDDAKGRLDDDYLPLSS